MLLHNLPTLIKRTPFEKITQAAQHSSVTEQYVE